MSTDAFSSPSQGVDLNFPVNSMGSGQKPIASSSVSGLTNLFSTHSEVFSMKPLLLFLTESKMGYAADVERMLAEPRRPRKNKREVPKEAERKTVEIN